MKTRLKVSIYTREPIHSKLANDKNVVEIIRSIHIIQTDPNGLKAYTIFKSIQNYPNLISIHNMYGKISKLDKILPKVFKSIQMYLNCIQKYPKVPKSINYKISYRI